MRGTFSWTGGTGKYAGIRGDGTFVDYSGEFLPLAEGTVVSHRTFEGSYRTPTRWRFTIDLDQSDPYLRLADVAIRSAWRVVCQLWTEEKIPAAIAT